tara:strand:+ start:662 stop:1867 length:1206 start_codon:yes stop_codon:yes gene_type:complete
MAFYNRLKTMKSAPVGTIMPWGGQSSSGNLPNNIPTGWIVCDGRTFEANDFPLLASILGNTYGPTDTSIVGNFPDYDEGDVFRVPNMNGRSMVDIELSYLQEEKYQFSQPDAENVIGSLISDDGTGVTPPTIYSADTDLKFQLDPIDTMAGKIQNITLNDPTWSKTYYTIGRKLGIDHTPGHKHAGQYTTAFPSGKYVQVFEAPIAGLNGGSNYESANLNGIQNTDTADTWGSGYGSMTYYDENSLVLTNESKTFTQDRIPEANATRAIPAHAAYTAGFSDTYNVAASGAYDHSLRQVTGVFPPPTTIFGKPNYYNGNVSQTYPTNLSHLGQDFTDQTVASHNHFSFDVSMNMGGLRIPPNIAVNNVQSYTVNVSDIPDALNILMDNQTPSQTVIMIIRAY